MANMLNAVYINGKKLNGLISVNHNPNCLDCLRIIVDFNKDDELHKYLSSIPVEDFVIDYYPYGKMNNKKWTTKGEVKLFKESYGSARILICAKTVGIGKWDKYNEKIM